MMSPHRTALALILALLILHGRLPAAQEAPQRLPIRDADLEEALGEQWFGVYLLGKKVGYAVERLARVAAPEPPGYRGTMQFHVKWTSLGIKSEDHFTETVEFDGRPPHSFRKGSYTESDDKSKQTIDLHKTDNGFEVTTRVDQDKQTRKIPALDYQLADYLGPILWMRRGVKVGDQFTSRAFDFEDLSLTSEIRKVAATKSSTVEGIKVTYHEVDVTYPKEGISGHERYDQKGQLLSMRMAKVFEFRLEPEKVARNTEHSGDLFALGTVKIDKPLGNAARLKSLVLEVIGEEVSSIRSGPRQAVSRSDSGKHLCKLGKAHATPTRATEQEIRDYLAETASYPTSHPQIQALLEKALGNASTPRAKVRRLVRFVHRYIEPSYTAQPLTVLNILKEKQGDCSEYALLFTALARAAGIPAREVFGLVYMDDDARAFGPHAWNEVVLDGHWVPIDASCNEIEVNPTHISFGSGMSGALDWLSSFGKMRFKLVAVEPHP